MIIRLLPTYIYFFMEAQNAQPFSIECIKAKLLILNNFGFKYLRTLFANRLNLLHSI